MKKRLNILVGILSFFIGINAVSAKEQELTCNYTGTYDDKELKMVCQFYDNNSHSCTISSLDNNQENFSNWGTIAGGGFNAKDYYKQNKKCFDYVIFLDKHAAAGYEIYAADTYTTATAIVSDRKAANTSWDVVVLTSNDKSSSSGENDETILTAIEMLSNIGSYFELDDYCGFKDNVYYVDVNKTGYRSCQSKMTIMYDQINTWDAYVKEQISAGKLTNNSDIVKKYYKTRDAARATVNDYFDETHIEDPSQGVGDTSGVVGDPTTGCDVLGGTNSKTVKLLSWVVKIVRFGIPILIIILGATDFFRILFSGEEKTYKESFSRFTKRLLIGVIIIFVPYILHFLVTLSGVDTQYGIDNFFCGVIDATSGVKATKKDPNEYTDSNTCYAAGYIWNHMSENCVGGTGNTISASDCTNSGNTYVGDSASPGGGRCVRKSGNEIYSPSECEEYGYTWTWGYGPGGGTCK